jgi:hypothetical protein
MRGSSTFTLDQKPGMLCICKLLLCLLLIHQIKSTGLAVYLVFLSDVVWILKLT